MDLTTLRDKQTAIESSFNDFAAQKKEHADKSAEIDAELIKLQGEYRLVTELIDNFKIKESKNAK